MSKSLPGRPSRRELAIVCSLALTLGGCGGGSSAPSVSSGGGSRPTTYSLSGAVSGLGAASGLVLVNDGGDATTVAANSTGFTMNTPVAAGSVYDITVRSQPYGLTLACSVSNGSGTASGNVTSIAVSCSNATPAQKAIAGYFANPLGVAVDASGNVFVADNGDNSIREIPYSGGSYGAAITVGSGFSFPYAVAMDANGNVFVADAGHNSVKEIPYSSGSYGAPITVASGFLTPTQVLQGDLCPTGIAVSPSGSVFAVCNSDLDEIPLNGSSYGAPITVASGSGFRGVALGAKGNVFVADAGANAVYEVPFNGSGYGAPIPLGSGFNYPEGVALDADGDVFVSDSLNQELKEIPFSGGSYGAPITVATGSGNSAPGSPFPGFAGLAVDTNSNVFVADAPNNVVWEVPHIGGTYGTPVAVGSGISTPAAFAVDANDNLFVADVTSSSIREIPYSGGGTYHTAITVGPGLGDLISVTVAPNGNVIAAKSTSVGLTEIPFSSGAYLIPGPLSDRQGNPIDLYGNAPCLTTDANDNLFFLFDNGMNDQPIEELQFSAGYYESSAQKMVTMGIGGCSGIAVDSNQNVFVTINGVAYELPFSGGSYGAALTLNTGSEEFRGMAVDANDDVFVADIMHNVVTEFPFTNGSYGAPISLGSGFNGPFSVVMGHNGQLFVADRENIWQLGP